jgi:hypothetical protein
VSTALSSSSFQSSSGSEELTVILVVRYGSGHCRAYSCRGIDSTPH